MGRGERGSVAAPSLCCRGPILHCGSRAPPPWQTSISPHLNMMLALFKLRSETVECESRVCLEPPCVTCFCGGGHTPAGTAAPTWHTYGQGAQTGAVPTFSWLLFASPGFPG